VIESAVVEELTHPDAQELLRSASIARLAYTGPDGLPRVVPAAFHWDGTSIVVCTATTAPKVRALAERPEVAVVIDDGDSPATARSLSVRGVAVLETVDGVAEEYLAASRKSQDQADAVEFERAVRSLYDEMVRISVEPRWARCYHFGKGRVPGFLAELARRG
jgi:nitroimidazol reductase NimA-like FMN-containing flavoprotein (pyridoxamine 5'-phosphate oxidase superfamily)